MGLPWLGASESRTFLAGEVALDLLGHLHAQVGPAVVHGQQDPLQADAGVQGPLHQPDGAQQVAESLQGVVLTLDGYQHRVGGAQPVQGQQLQGGRAVDEDVVVAVGHRVQGLTEQVLPVIQADHLDAGAGQGLGGGEHIAVGGGEHRLGGLSPVDEDLVDTGVGGGLVHAHPGGGVGLGVKITDQHPLSLGPQGRGQVHTGGGLSHAALLIDDRNSFCHSIQPFFLS